MGLVRPVAPDRGELLQEIEEFRAFLAGTSEPHGGTSYRFSTHVTNCVHARTVDDTAMETAFARA